MAQRVLVVDDYPPTVELIREALEGVGFSVISARNGMECLQKVESERPDLLILDIIMPVMDGLEVLRQLRAKPETRYLPVIVLTGRSEWVDFLDGNRAGADLYLTKPLQIGRVVSSAQWMLGTLHQGESPAQDAEEDEVPRAPCLLSRETVEF